MRFFLSTISALLLTMSQASAEGFLAGKPEKLPDLEIGLGDAGYGISQKTYALTTGKGYRLKIKSTGAKECAWTAEAFSASIWLRKIEINKIEIKAPFFTEIEMENEGEVDIFFVPIRPGEYTWVCKGLAEKGMTGTFAVK